MCVVKETEHIQSVLVMVCICTFLVYHSEMLPKRYHFCILLREAMLQSGTGFKSSNLNIASKKNKILEYSCIQKGETLIKVGSEFIWVWWVAAVKPRNKIIIGFDISNRRNTFVAMEKIIAGLTKVYDKHSSASPDGGTWYPQACRFLRMKHYISSSYEKSLLERTIQYTR